MKNIVLIIITILLAVLIGIIMIDGKQILAVEFSSIAQIREKNDMLKQKATEVSNLNQGQYQATIEKLQSAQEELKSNKSDYLDIASTSTEEEIKEANQTQVYSMEYLWSKIGNYATENGIQLKMNVTESENSDKSTLDFLAIGYYESIRDFILAIEQDANLGFRIQNFKLIDLQVDENNKDEVYKESYLQASFIIDNIAIKEEKITTKVEVNKNDEKESSENKETSTEKESSENTEE